MLEANIEPIVPPSPAFHVRVDFVCLFFLFEAGSLEPALTAHCPGQDRPGWPEAHRHPSPVLQRAGI